MPITTSEVAVNNVVPVTGPLTDAELRATPVSVNATFTPSGTQDVNLVSTILVPVSDNGGSLTVDGTVAVSSVAGSVAVTGPLTDTQLRATPVPISGTVSIAGSSGTATATVSRISVTNTVATTLSASNSGKSRVIIYNEGGTLYVKYGSAASATDYTYTMATNTTLEIIGFYGLVTARKASGTTLVQVTEVGI